MVLMEIEYRTGKSISEMFDFIAGTSTGGIITLALSKPDDNGKPQYTAKDLVKLYEEEGKVIFSTSIRDLNESIISLSDKYNSLESLNNISKLIKFIPSVDKIKNYIDEAKNSISSVLKSTSKIEDRINIILGPKLSVENLKKVLKKYLGNTKLKDTLNNLLITSYNLKTTEYSIILNNKHKLKENNWNDVYIRDLAVATSAVPTIFEPAYITNSKNEEYPMVDGGIFAPNPSLCAYIEAKRMLGGIMDKYMVVSLGTGYYNNNPIDYNKAKDWGILDWADKLIKIVLNGMSRTVDNYMEGLMNNEKYYRFNPVFSEDDKINDDPTDASRNNIEALKNIASEIIKNNDKEIDEICNLLT
jgi:patatin-like phospholipase/acyl hydrolase